MYVITCRGEMWARNPENMKLVPRKKAGGEGIYILFDDSTPVYVGRGNLRRRFAQHSNSKRRGQSWDHFSWYVVRNPERRHELESLLLRMLPPFLRMLNRQRGKLKGATKVSQANLNPIPIKRPHAFGGTKRKGRKRRLVR
jgi:hypothetical protein